MPDFYPRRDADLRMWVENFAARVSASPGDYGLSEALVAEFVGLQQAYAQWYARANQASTRGVASVRMKDEVRKALMAKGRELVAVIRARPETTGAQLQSLGLGVRRKARRAVPRPGDAPRVWVRQVRGRRARVWLEDRSNDRARKPAGVAMAVLLYWVGQKTPASVHDWRFGGTTGDPKLTWTLPVPAKESRPGVNEPVWLVACWVNERGERGPWSEPVQWWVTQVDEPMLGQSAVIAGGVGGGAGGAFRGRGRAA